MEQSARKNRKNKLFKELHLKRIMNIKPTKGKVIIAFILSLLFPVLFIFRWPGYGEDISLSWAAVVYFVFSLLQKKK